jgi:hypothetical protein
MARGFNAEPSPLLEERRDTLAEGDRDAICVKTFSITDAPLLIPAACSGSDASITSGVGGCTRGYGGNKHTTGQTSTHTSPQRGGKNHKHTGIRGTHLVAEAASELRDPAVDADPSMTVGNGMATAGNTDGPPCRTHGSPMVNITSHTLKLEQPQERPSNSSVLKASLPQQPLRSASSYFG